VDWAIVGQLAEREKLLGVLWPAIGGLRDRIPERIAGAMERQALVTEFRMAAFGDRLASVIRLLDDHGIPVMLMKGAAMAVSVYGSFAKRPMGDLDILVRERDAMRAWTLLRDEGWALEYEDADTFYEDHQHLTPLVAPGGANLVVEIHRCLLYPRGPFQLPEEQVWEEALPVTVGERRAYIPSPEHQVLHLCIHFAWSHALEKGLGRTVRDLSALLERESLDWERLVELAVRTRSTTCCYWTLRLARTLGDVGVPPSVLAGLAPRSPRIVLDGLERVIIAQSIDPLQGVSPSLRLQHFVWERAIRPELNGHGDVRPWRANAGWADVVDAPPPPGLLQRVAGQIRMLPAWMRFLRNAFGRSVARRVRPVAAGARDTAARASVL